MNSFNDKNPEKVTIPAWQSTRWHKGDRFPPLVSYIKHIKRKHSWASSKTQIASSTAWRTRC
jgi:hypothetical protein